MYDNLYIKDERSGEQKTGFRKEKKRIKEDNEITD